MKYSNIVTGKFIKRPNRFIAHVEIDGKEEIAHVKNTGRCKELLIPGCEIYLEENDNPKRKTRFSLIGVKKGNLLINMDSQAPNKVVGEWLAQGGIYQNPTRIKPETTYGSSRFDFYMEENEKKAYIEVKGVTLEEDKIARFPDAPTERGVKHINELIQAKEEGYDAYIIFVIQMQGMKLFKPNDETHKEFGDTLRKAKECGVHVIAVDCEVMRESLVINTEVPINLS